MRLATYLFNNGPGVAVVREAQVIDCRTVAGSDMAAFLGKGSDAMTHLAEHLAELPARPLMIEALLAPVQPSSFLGIGLNYRAHAAEMGRELPRSPAVFAKARNSISPPYGTILRDPAAPSLDYEGELGIVIGRTCHKVDEARAAEVIAGYVVVNDVTVRERITPEAIMLAKSAITHGPFGPWIVTRDEVPDPHLLRIRTWVNGELRQDGSTADLHFNCYQLIAQLSEALTLQAGDIVTTGSPSGSGNSFTPARWLVPGDVVRVAIDGIGWIEHVVKDGGS